MFPQVKVKRVRPGKLQLAPEQRQLVEVDELILARDHPILFLVQFVFSEAHRQLSPGGQLC
jgi:hypothetical protein